MIKTGKMKLEKIVKRMSINIKHQTSNIKHEGNLVLNFNQTHPVCFGSAKWIYQ